MQISGVYTALATPFRNGKIDESALLRLVEEQVVGGVDGVVPVGTTGESPTLTIEEHLRVIELTIKASAGRVKVIAGTGANNTAEAIYLTQEAGRLGADGSLQVAPYYNKPTPAGIFAHFSAIAQSTKLPIVLYSVPSRCGIEIGVDTVAKLAASQKNIIAIKESGGSVERVHQLRQALPSDFNILSGDDYTTLPFMSLGAVGVVSVASNLIPHLVVKLVRTFAQGNLEEAEELSRRLYPLFRDLFIESNPVPIKTAMARAGWMTSEVRLPLVPLQPANLEKLEATLKSLPR